MQVVEVEFLGFVLYRYTISFDSSGLNPLPNPQLHPKSIANIMRGPRVCPLQTQRPCLRNVLLTDVVG